MALIHDVKVTTVAATAAGTTTISGSSLDMAGFSGAMFVVRLGTPATNNNLRIQQCDTSTGTYADLLGTRIGDNSTDTPLIADIFRPVKQFLRYQIARGTSSTIDVVTVVQYGARNRPTTQPGAAVTEVHNWLAEGTA